MSQKRLRKKRKSEKIAEVKTEVNPNTGIKLKIREILKKNWIFLTIISVGIVLLYLNSLNSAFVSDDYATILNNPDITKWSYGFQDGASTYVINTFLAKTFGVFPLPFHIFSTLLFIAICWLAYVLIDYLFGKKIAMITLTIFAVHPIHVEAVSWISGKPYLLIAFYVLLATLLFIKFIENENFWYLLASMAAFFLGFLTDQPRPFSFFLIIPLYLLLKRIDLRKIKVFKYWPYLAGLAVLALILIWPQIKIRIANVNSGYNASDSIFYDPTFQYPTGLTKYLQLLWAPVDLTLYHTMFTFPVWLNWSVLLLLFGAIGYFFFKDRRIFFALGFMLAAVLPSISPVKVSWLVAERYMFLGSLGFCLFMAIIFNEIWGKVKILTPVILGLLVILFGIRTYYRNIDWQTNHNLWVNTCQVSPNSHNAWNNIGDDYDKLQDYADSIKGFTQSTIVKPNYADAYHNRANIFFKIGRLDLARESYNIALGFSPNLYQTYLSLTQIDLMEQKFDLAQQDAEKAIQLQPTNPQPVYVLGIVYAEMGKLDQAKQIFEAILQRDPGYTLASQALQKLETGQT